MKKKNNLEKILLSIFALFFAGEISSCSTMKKTNVIPVQNFDVEKYSGDWYEIGRFDFKWEKNMKNVRTTYSINQDGSVKVINTGYDYIIHKEKQSVGKAKFAGKNKDTGNLKVSFFGPFYSAYTVIAIDPEYKYSLVAGSTTKLLWILSRTPTIPEEVKENYIQIAKNAGYDLTDFIWTSQD